MAARSNGTKNRPQTQLIGGDLEYEPLQLSSEDVPEVETMPLFYLDGEEYRIPKTFPTNLSLQFLRMLRTDGEMVSVGWLLEEILGKDAYTALMEYKGLKPEHLQKITVVVQNLALGALEDPKDNSSNGPRR